MTTTLRRSAFAPLRSEYSILQPWSFPHSPHKQYLFDAPRDPAMELGRLFFFRWSQIDRIFRAYLHSVCRHPGLRLCHLGLALRRSDQCHNSLTASPSHHRIMLLSRPVPARHTLGHLFRPMDQPSHRKKREKHPMEGTGGHGRALHSPQCRPLLRLFAHLA